MALILSRTAFFFRVGASGRIVLFLFAMACAAEGLANGAVPMQSPQMASLSLPPGKEILPEDLRGKISAAASSSGWIIVSEQPGAFVLKRNMRDKHEFEITLHYDTKHVQAEYLSSRNLEYRVRGRTTYIHWKYNHFVALLLQDIVASVTF